jgi:hypothetical protein
MSREPRSQVDPRRRHLIAALAAAPLAGALLPGALAAPSPGAQQGDEPEAPEREEEPGPHRAEAEALLQVVERRYGAYLDPGAARSLLSSIEGSLGAAAAMSAAGLRNADEPGIVFRPYRSDDP